MTDPLPRLAEALQDRYRLERELGEGGMATVYLAADLRHDRKVAIKVLRPELSAVIGAERFLREIKTIASLQHPHILGLIDSGEVDGTAFYVMPYVEGESLRDRMAREKQLAVRDAVRIASEVAGALDYAHRHGVIHRDIKPENILLHDGRALVADFGIALAVSTAGSTRMTETGMSLGTPHYMSPEQAMGEREISARSDVYALGCVLYEMLVGEPPFTGPTAQAIIARAVTESPRSMRLQRHTVPEHVEAAVVQALEKLPADRFATAAEFAAALDDRGTGALRAATTSRQATARGAARAPGAASRRSVLLVAALAVTAVIAAWGWLRPGPEAAGTIRQVVRLWRSPLEGMLEPGSERVATQAALAPDGSSLVFVDSGGGNWQLHLKHRSEARATVLPGTEGGVSPFYSPDGDWIAFLTTDGRLRKVPVRGGGVVTLASDAHLIYPSGAWLDDGTIVYLGRSNAVMRMSGEGGPATAVPGSVGDEVNVIGLAPLPGARGYLFTLCPGNCAIDSRLMVRDFAADSATVLVPSAAGGWYLPSGHLLYTTREGGLFVAPFDQETLALGSGAIPLSDGVMPASVAVSASGMLLYVLGEPSRGRSELVWVSRDGVEEPAVPGWVGNFEYPALSPDGRAIAVSLRDATTHVWIWRPDGTRQLLTRDGTMNWRPAWLPDGRSLYFVSNRADQGTGAMEFPSVWWMPADGSEPPRLVLRRRYGTWEVEPSRDGQWLVYRSDEEGSNSNVHARRTGSDTLESTVFDGDDITTVLALSPDGRWLAYTSDVSGRYEVYVTSFPDRATNRLVSTNGGLEPRWSRDGRELFLKDGGNLVVVSVPPGPVFTPGPPRVLFDVRPYRLARNRQQYDVSPDGRRFLMIRDLREESPQDIVVAEGWFSELRERLRR